APATAAPGSRASARRPSSRGARSDATGRDVGIVVGGPRAGRAVHDVGHVRGLAPVGLVLVERRPFRLVGPCRHHGRDDLVPLDREVRQRLGGVQVGLREAARQAHRDRGQQAYGLDRATGQGRRVLGGGGGEADRGAREEERTEHGNLPARGRGGVVVETHYEPYPGAMTEQTDMIAEPATKRVLLAEPRGYCAGVDRAVETVEKALEKHGAPLYMRKEIVHNKYVVETFTDKGVIFVDEADEAPRGANMVFSAHGVSPAVRDSARDLQLNTFDATCPLVTKVHTEVKRFAKEGYQILLVGHEGHEEVEGTAGEAPDVVTLVDGIDSVDELDIPVDTEKLI